MKSYQDNSISFEYPEGWQISRDEGEKEYAVSLEGPGTVLWIVSVNFNRPSVDAQLQLVVESFRSEYPGCDVYDSSEGICLLPTVGKDIEFFKFELVSRANVRVCETGHAVVSVISQMSDSDAIEYGELLQTITGSLMYVEGDAWADDEIDVDLFNYHNLFGGAD